jgi:hypothetical protein
MSKVKDEPRSPSVISESSSLSQLYEITADTTNVPNLANHRIWNDVRIVRDLNSILFIQFHRSEESAQI